MSKINCVKCKTNTSSKNGSNTFNGKFFPICCTVCNREKNNFFKEQKNYRSINYDRQTFTGIDITISCIYITYA